MKDDLGTRAQEAWIVLNDILYDLLVGTRSFDTLEPLLGALGGDRELITGFRRMFYFHLLLGLSKWREFYDHYKAVIPTDCKEACTDLRKEIDKRGIVQLRNRYVGHIWDRVARRPLLAVEIVAMADPIAANRREFLLWINDPAGNVFPKTVCSIIQTTRDRIGEAFSLRPEELLRSPVR